MNEELIDKLKKIETNLDKIGDECKRLSADMNLKILQARLLHEKMGGKE